MARTPQYELLRSSITERDQRAVFDVLLDHVGVENKIGIDAIAMQVYGKRSDNHIRKTRDVIEDLRGLGVPVCSNSGVAGRWLAANQEELNGCIADYEARRMSIQNAISALRQARIPAADQFPTRSAIQQPRLI